MPKITLRVSDNTLNEIKRLSKSSKLTITDYLLSKAVPNYMDNILTVSQIIDKLDITPKGNIFSLSDLYTEEVWESFTPGSRISTGRLFCSAYDKNLYDLKNRIEFLGKNSANLAFYKKLTDN